MTNQHKWIQSFSRTKNRGLSDRQRQLLDDLLPEVKADKRPFVEYQDIQIEVGFGNGEHLAQLAINQPGTCFIGCEPFINGVAKLLSAIDKFKIENIRIFVGDCRNFLDEVPTRSVSCIYMLFPDPWPKKRHYKRRLLKQDFLEALWRILKSDGILRFASDVEGYARDVFDLIKESGLFLITVPNLRLCAYGKNPWSTIMTKYEKKARLTKTDCFFIEAFMKIAESRHLQ
ncbi:MAG: tRNA (guanosine(46)-N7)-methyltransferase TrmB [Holosporales bacterium]|jgi:tRNA (guanine-N7-)-methyltransferase|nr:tRNA (guanosine(46)-N7)-methyltransferase TrmB [Holosporales bacterium]